MPVNTSNTTTETANNTTAGAANSRTGGSGGVPGVPDLPELPNVDGFPSGWELLRGAIAGAVSDFADGVGAVVDVFNRSFLTLPASGTSTQPLTWVPPEDPFWVAAFTVYMMLSAFVLPMVWGVGWFNVALPRGQRRADRAKSFATAFALIVAGFTFLMMWFHFWNEASLAFAPSGGEFMRTPGNVTKLGVGVILGAVLLVYQSIVVLAGVVLHLTFVVLTFVFVALWPLSVGLYVTDFFAVETMGASGIMGTLALGPLQFAKALVLRLVFQFPLSLTDPDTVVTFILVAIGVTIAFVGIPYFGAKRLLPRSIIAAGGRVGTKGGQSPRNRLNDLQERVPSGKDLQQQISSIQRSDSVLGRRGSGTGSSLQSRARNLSSRASSGFGRGGGRSRTGSEDTRARTGSHPDTRTRINSDRRRSD